MFFADVLVQLRIARWSACCWRCCWWSSRLWRPAPSPLPLRYAVGGSAEAARRAGIPVNRIRIYVFMLSSFMAGWGGIILASRLAGGHQLRRRQPGAQLHRSSCESAEPACLAGAASC
jgi:hypothetical protein